MCSACLARILLHKTPQTSSYLFAFVPNSTETPRHRIVDKHTILHECWLVTAHKTAPHLFRGRMLPKWQAVEKVNIQSSSRDSSRKCVHLYHIRCSFFLRIKNKEKTCRILQLLSASASLYMSGNCCYLFITGEK